MTMRYIIWPEGQPDKAVETTGTIHRYWLEWWTGIKTWFPKPTDARRICTLALYQDDAINAQGFTAAEIAWIMEQPE